LSGELSAPTSDADRQGVPSLRIAQQGEGEIEGDAEGLLEGARLDLRDVESVQRELAVDCVSLPCDLHPGAQRSLPGLDLVAGGIPRVGTEGGEAERGEVDVHLAGAALERRVDVEAALAGPTPRDRECLGLCLGPAQIAALQGEIAHAGAKHRIDGLVDDIGAPARNLQERHPDLWKRSLVVGRSHLFAGGGTFRVVHRRRSGVAPKCRLQRRVTQAYGRQLDERGDRSLAIAVGSQRELPGDDLEGAPRERSGIPALGRCELRHAQAPGRIDPRRTALGRVAQQHVELECAGRPSGGDPQRKKRPRSGGEAVEREIVPGQRPVEGDRRQAQIGPDRQRATADLEIELQGKARVLRGRDVSRADAEVGLEIRLVRHERQVGALDRDLREADHGRRRGAARRGGHVLLPRAGAHEGLEVDVAMDAQPWCVQAHGAELDLASPHSEPVELERLDTQLDRRSIGSGEVQVEEVKIREHQAIEPQRPRGSVLVAIGGHSFRSDLHRPGPHQGDEPTIEARHGHQPGRLDLHALEVDLAAQQREPAPAHLDPLALEEGGLRVERGRRLVALEDGTHRHVVDRQAAGEDGEVHVCDANEPTQLRRALGLDRPQHEVGQQRAYAESQRQHDEERA
jgi:hypothetical protein